MCIYVWCRGKEGEGEKWKKKREKGTELYILYILYYYYYLFKCTHTYDTSELLVLNYLTFCTKLIKFLLVFTSKL